MATLTDALDFLAGASEADMERVIDGIKARRQMLRRVAAAAVQLDMRVVTENLSPKYLNGLRGTVTSIRGQRADLTLDEESTKVLRFSGKRYYVSPDTKHHVLQGVPLACCKPIDA